LRRQWARRLAADDPRHATSNGVLRESGLEYLQVGDYLVHKRGAAASNGATSH
jgi:hypothetical protein